ncbi:MAG: M15 family metallopeptidase [Clostridia bacterium]|nr:M15 family metallopeptidase [Clostridia bacterium]
MRSESKTRACIALIVVFVLFTAAGFLTRKSEKEKPVTAQPYQEESNNSKREFVTRTVDFYERLKNEDAPTPKKKPLFPSDNEKVLKAWGLGIIEESDTVFYSDRENISLQTATNFLYRAMMAYGKNYEITDAEARHILNDCFNNAAVDEENRIGYAFAIKHGIIEANSKLSPTSVLSKEDIDTIFERMENTFNPDICISVGGRTVWIGESEKELLKAFGNPNRIDVSEFGFSWYVYSADYENFIMVGVREDVVCAFYTNCQSFAYKTLKAGADALKAEDLSASHLVFLKDENEKIDAVYYNPCESDQKVSEAIREAKEMEILDILNSCRYKKKKGALVYESELSRSAADNSRSMAVHGSHRGAEHELVALYGSDIFECYRQLLSIRYDRVLLCGDKRSVPAGAGIWYDGSGLYLTLSANLDEEAQILPAATVLPMQKQYYEVKSENVLPHPKVISGDMQVCAGDDVVLEVDPSEAAVYHVEIQNNETRDYVVNADITGDKTRLVFPAELFESGIDYTALVNAGDAALADTADIMYGEPVPPVILSPTQEHHLTNSDIDIVWKSEKYTDFQVSIYNQSNELLGSARVIDQKHTEVSGLEAGRYFLCVSAMRRDTNYVKAYANTSFEISIPKSEFSVKYPKQAKISFKNNRYARIFGDGLQVYISKAEADANMVVVTVPVWKLRSDGSKVPSTSDIKVNKTLAAEVVQIFTEIYNGSEKFPIKSIGGYSWRQTATGGKSQHSYGTAIDINPDENYCIYNTGKRIGSFWKPYDDPYSIPPDGDVVRVFKKYGWIWGGEWNSLKDYMHFSYLGG